MRFLHTQISIMYLGTNWSYCTLGTWSGTVDMQELIKVNYERIWNVT